MDYRGSSLGELMWVVDISPDQPFPPLSAGNGGGAVAPGENPATDMEHWAWATVDATSGSEGIWFA